MKEVLYSSRRESSICKKGHGEVRVLCDLQEGNKQGQVGRKALKLGESGKVFWLQITGDSDLTD